METPFEQIRDQQKQSWNKFASGWKKWDTFTMDFLRPMGAAIINNLQLKVHDQVLDVATGTGEPGLTIASLIPAGKVTGTDLSEDMLAIARANAHAKGILNYDTLLADSCELPLNTGSYDAVSCRMGFMFFPDMTLAAQEMYRILKPGGKISIAVWSGPEDNNWITTIMSVIQQYIELPAPLPDAPGMFRCSKPGMMKALFERSGFKNITEKEIKGTVDYLSFNYYWELMMDVAAPIAAALSDATDATKAAIKEAVSELFRSKNEPGKAELDYAALIITAEK